MRIPCCRGRHGLAEDRTALCVAGPAHALVQRLRCLCALQGHGDACLDMRKRGVACLTFRWESSNARCLSSALSSTMCMSVCWAALAACICWRS